MVTTGVCVIVTQYSGSEVLPLQFMFPGNPTSNITNFANSSFHFGNKCLIIQITYS